jgi:hypothetical protein
LQVLKAFSALWSGQNLPFNIWPEIIVCRNVGDMHGDLYSTCHAFQHGFQLFATQRCTLLRISGFTKISRQAFCTCLCNTLSHWSVLNTLKSLGVHSRKYNGLMWGGSCWSVQVLSESVVKMRLCRLMHEPHALLLMKRHMFQE